LKQVAKNLSPSLKVVARRANNESGIKRAFQAFSGPDFIGALVTADSYFNNNRAIVIEAARANNVPAIYQWRAFAENGGLMSFGPSIQDAYEEAGRYVARILPPAPQEDPAEMACSEPDPSSFELVVKKSTALALGLNLPPATLLGKQVIQIL
jgi:putative ABC transport system substrate-binding protein